MLTISQLARYAGVTVRAVRHYHQVGLLPEPERDRSGYRTYDAAAVVRLVRIRTLAEAGVPLLRVGELLDAGPGEFDRAVGEVDASLRAEIRRLREHRRRIALLGSGERLTLPPSVVGYLDRLRALGVDERYVTLERDAWIMLASQVPERIDAIIEDKHTQLDDPDMQRLYGYLGDAVDWDADDPRVVEVADLLEKLVEAAIDGGAGGPPLGDGLDDVVVQVMDASAEQAAPAASRLTEILHERGWRGWTRIERDPDRGS
ncbi:MerR family transcriptional regulator [Phycicoccus sp. BSK3Z-2]|uniref:MerR family transcriptional regulator n=1 Tax=Phycicoccus avicenniae TaxID=2828860 RepID=A0A941HZT3_9MICO|nr:MerR family transcriptional regulator [Phycicoccus avicenniae]MBR7742489.1 MerR family transcriptional regulator [Phycicoccus avicenniae]